MLQFERRNSLSPCPIGVKPIFFSQISFNNRKIPSTFQTFLLRIKTFQTSMLYHKATVPHWIEDWLCCIVLIRSYDKFYFINKRKPFHSSDILIRTFNKKRKFEATRSSFVRKPLIKRILLIKTLQLYHLKREIIFFIKSFQDPVLLYYYLLFWNSSRGDFYIHIIITINKRNCCLNRE